MTSPCFHHNAMDHTFHKLESQLTNDQFDWEYNLKLIVAGIASKIGEEFFQVCVHYLAEVLQIQYALIAEFVDGEKPQGRVLAFWAGEDFGPNFEYTLSGTPCGLVYENGLQIYRNSIQKIFPEDEDLITLQAESYLGIVITDSQGKRIGHIAGLHTEPLKHRYEQQESILRIFAARSAAEIERQWAEKELKQKNIDLQKTVEKLKQTQSQLIHAEKMSGLGQMVAGVAHEINNPVTFISGNLNYVNDYTQDLLELVDLFQYHYPDLHPEIQTKIAEVELDYIQRDLPNLLNSIQNGASRISTIVKSLRTFSRLDEAGIKVVDLHENIESTLLILQARLNSQPFAIEVVKNYGDLPNIPCCPRTFNQVIMNLINNAIDALEVAFNSSESRDNLAQITIQTQQLDLHRVQIMIADNGCGMSEETQSQIFNPFFTTKPIGQGTGLGLSISYQIIVEQHQGTLQCVSSGSMGTRFIIEIPTSFSPA